jgi:tubulin--tyrosine ligase like protein 10
MKYKYILRPDKHNDDMKKMLDRRSNWIQSFDKMRQLKNNNWNLLWKLTNNIEIFNIESELYFLDSENTPDSILKNQIVNHIPFSNLITQKYNLINTLGNYYTTTNNFTVNHSQCDNQLFEVIPETFIIDKNTNTDDLKFENIMYIVKPEDAFAGMGISVFNDKTKLLKYIRDGLDGKLIVKNYTKTTADPEKQYLKFGENDKWIVQKYIMNPLRLEGRKFDIRVNVLVNNDYDIYFSPYIIVRTSSLPYLPILTGNDNIDKATHITNNAFQKQVPLFYGRYEESNILRLEQLQQYFDLSYGKIL